MDHQVVLIINDTVQTLFLPTNTPLSYQESPERYSHCITIRLQ
jgi:hypothetical protein